jgi:hypothetical protein
LCPGHKFISFTGADTRQRANSDARNRDRRSEVGSFLVPKLCLGALHVAFLGVWISIPDFRIALFDFGTAIPSFRIALLDVGIAIPGFRIALLDVGIAIPGFRIALLDVGIAIPSFRIALLDVEIAISGFGIALLDCRDRDFGLANHVTCHTSHVTGCEIPPGIFLLPLCGPL